MEKSIKSRNSALELLRMIAMFLILHSHYSSSAYAYQSCEFNFANIFHGMQTGNLGVVIFVVLTGYLTVNSVFRLKKLVFLVFQVCFYSVGMYSVSCLTGIRVFSASDFILSLFPITGSLYWFCTAYVLLYLLSPFINKFIHSVSKETHLKLNILMFILWSVIPTLTRQVLFSSGVVEFVMFYSFGAYLKKYPVSILANKNKALKTIVFNASVLILSVAVILKLGEYYPWLSEHNSILYPRYSVFVIGLSVGLLAFFSKIKPFYCKPLNVVSSCVFATYLIHDNRFFREYLWLDLFKTAETINDNSSVLRFLVVAVIIFAGCFVIETVRKAIIEKPLMLLYDKAHHKFKPGLTAYFNKKLKLK